MMGFASELIGLLTAIILASGALPVLKKLREVEMLDICVIKVSREQS